MDAEINTEKLNEMLKNVCEEFFEDNSFSKFDSLAFSSLLLISTSLNCEVSEKQFDHFIQSIVETFKVMKALGKKDA